MTTTYKLKGECVVIVNPYRGWRYLSPDEARRLADEYEAAIPQLRALADQVEANAGEAWERKEAEIAIALREPGAFRHGDRVLVARPDGFDQLRLWRLIVHESGRVVELKIPDGLDLGQLPDNTIPPTWVRNMSARTAHLYRGGGRAVCGHSIDWRPRGAGKAKLCPKCAAIQDAGLRVEEAT